MLVHRSKMAASSSVSLTEELFQVTRLNQYKDSIQAIHLGEGISEKMFSSSLIKYYQQKCIDYKQNTKKLWGLINKINKKTVDKSTLITKIKKDNIIYQVGRDVSNILAKQFATIGKSYAEKIGQPLTPFERLLKQNPHE